MLQNCISIVPGNSHDYEYEYVGRGEDVVDDDKQVELTNVSLKEAICYSL